MSDGSNQLAKLRAACREWSNEDFTQLFLGGPPAFATPEAWALVRREAVRRGVVSEAGADALEADPTLGAQVLSKVTTRRQMSDERMAEIIDAARRRIQGKRPIHETVLALIIAGAGGTLVGFVLSRILGLLRW